MKFAKGRGNIMNTHDNGRTWMNKKRKDYGKNQIKSNDQPTMQKMKMATSRQERINHA
jgi:hypothetical protein